MERGRGGAKGSEKTPIIGRDFSCLDGKGGEQKDTYYWPVGERPWGTIERRERNMR